MLARSQYLINSGVFTPLFQAQLMGRTALTTTHMQMRNSRGNVNPSSDKKSIFPEWCLPFSQAAWDLTGTLTPWLTYDAAISTLCVWSSSGHNYYIGHPGTTLRMQKWITCVLAVASKPQLWFFLRPLLWHFPGFFLFVQSQPSLSNQYNSYSDSTCRNDKIPDFHLLYVSPGKCN